LKKGPLLHQQEELTVSAALDQHLDYRDTSRWAGGRKPKNWAQSAQRVQWWDDMLAKKGDALEIEYLRENTLDKTVDYMVEQYGRKFALWVVSRVGLDGVKTTELLVHTFARCLARTRESDIAELLEVLGPEDRKRAQKELRKLQEQASLIAERMTAPEERK
jgi:predicted MarR family transcription regulator